MITLDSISYIDHIRCASYAFIEGYSRTQSHPPSGVLYNKYMTLLNRELMDNLGVDIRLPHCWYRWGDEVVRHDMPYLRWDHGDPCKTYISYSGECPIPESKDEIVCFSESFADSFIRRYSGDEGVDLAIDEIYSEAPFAFQNDYRRLRENLKIAQKGAAMENYYDLVRSLYEKAMESFPSESFPDMDVPPSQFKAVFPIALDERITIDRLQMISETFWFHFCYHLRLHEGCHANVPESTLSAWRQAIPRAFEDYECAMQNYAYYLTGGESENPVIIQLMADRQVRLDELEILMRENRGEGP